MVWLYLIALPALVLMVLLGIKRLMMHGGRSSYLRKDFLLSPEERQFFMALQSAVGDQFWICPKIPVDQVITPRQSVSRYAPYHRLADADEAVFPFLLIRLTDFSIAAALQLIVHRTLKNREKSPPESLLKGICQAAGLPLIRMETSPFYDESDIRLALSEATRREPLFISESDGRREPSLDTMEDLDFN